LVTELTGSAAEVIAVQENADITLGDDYDVMIDAGVEAASDLTDIDDLMGTGVIDAEAVTELTGSAAEVIAVQDNDDITLGEDYDVTLGDDDDDDSTYITVAAADLTAINADQGDGTLDALLVEEITGSADEVIAVQEDSGITLATDYDVTLGDDDDDSDTDIVVAAADLTDINADQGDGTLYADLVDEITGTAAEVIAVQDDAGISLSSFYDVTIDAGVEAAADLTTIDYAMSSGVIDASLVTELTGSAAEVILVQDSEDITLATDVDVTVSGTAAATDLTTVLAAMGTGTLDVTDVTEITGTAAEVLAVQENILFTLATDYDVVISGTFVAADIDSIDGNTDGDITYKGTADGETTADTIDFTGVTANVIINGYDGDDTITAGSGADSVNAGEGDDSITGGLGADTLTGGAGEDTFVFGTSATNGLDTITDFTVLDDSLDFSAFVAVGTATFSEANSGSTVALSAAKVINVTDSALTDWSDVLTILNAAIDTTVDVTGNAVILVGNGTDTWAYLYQDDTNAAAIETAELTLVGTLSGVVGNTGSFASANFSV
jgi:Ca2+-binding RTX toxin-like protein